MEILLFSTIPRRNTNDIAHELLLKFGSVRKLLDASFEEIIEVPNISEKTARFICLLGELNRRSNIKNLKSIVESKSYSDCLKFAEEEISKFKEEGIYILLLDSKGKPLFCEKISSEQGEIEKRIIKSKIVFSIVVAAALVFDYKKDRSMIPSSFDLEKVWIADNYLFVHNINLLEYFITNGDQIQGLVGERKYNCKISNPDF